MGEKKLQTYKLMLQDETTRWIQTCMVRDNKEMKDSKQKYVYAFTDLGFIVWFCLSLLPLQNDLIFQHQTSNILILILFMSWQLSLS